MAIPFFTRKSPEAGALKLTIQKFYRVSGGSTQLNGVESDIILPSRTDNAEIGESSLRSPLAYDEVAPVAFKPSPNAGELFLEQLRERSKARLAGDPEFAYVSEDMRRLRERLEKNSISTNKEIRQKELADDKARKESRKTERLARGPLIDAKVWQVTLDDVKNNRETLEVVAYERERDKKYSEEDPEEASEEEENGEKKEKPPEPDPIRNETVRIMSDLIELANLSKTASAKPSANPPAKEP